ncbi:perlucin-like protein [Mytilus galloprovincialis]|uniref:perlucin-like protein n=1 Tax=Mytilus galloprovincialis TaxID=29158 RepID=UPI003F7C27AD
MSCLWYFRLIISLCLSGYVLCQCRAGWKYHAGMCFYFSDEKKSWYEAAVNCRTHRSSLVVVNTHDINSFVVNQINRHGGSYWTDGTDDFQEGEWEWPSSGQLFNFTNWYHGQPDNHHSQGEDCLAIHAQHSSTWFDDQCSLKQKYVCYESSIQDGGFVIG